MHALGLAEEAVTGLRFFVVVRTYLLEAEPLALLRQLEEQAPSSTTVMLIDDTPDPARHRRFARDLFKRSMIYLPHPERYGKAWFWSSENEVLAAFEASGADVLVALADDCEITGDFFAHLRLAFAWARESGRPSGFVLHVDDSSRTAEGCWGSGPPVDMGDFELIGWTDGFHAFDRAAVQGLRVPPLPLRPGRGTGVGAYLSHQLRRRGVHIYRPRQSWVRHLNIPSRLNPQLRKSAPLRTVLWDGAKRDG